ncbi:MAG: tRNA (guanosine(46)-N7)-methyltransferase TrmB [Corallincola sp.]|nr:tRNA (guanosine(46)-N7)-methyltransferase TrmB [Corallincola sp.]
MSSEPLNEQQQGDEPVKHMRKVRSFVRREGRMTKRQEQALEQHWGQYGLSHGDGLIDPAQVFGRSAPLVVEIGFGMGKTLVELARTMPHKNFIGIEVHRAGVGSCIADAVEAGVTNLRLYEHDAVEVLRDCLPPASISELLLFFPDPWHKKRHNKRRIVQPVFAERVRQSLLVGGHWHMATDWQEYAEQMLEVMNSAPGFANTSASGDYVPRPDYRPLTKFEQRGINLGHGVWDLIFTRVD